MGFDHMTLTATLDLNFNIARNLLFVRNMSLLYRMCVLIYYQIMTIPF